MIPEETAGPYPGDGSNGVNVLTQSGIVRSDIRSSFGSSTTIAQGVPTTITLTVTDFDTGNTAAQGLAVYLWHCNREGLYSLYSPGVTNENYLRGVQVTDANGQVTFTSIFPACYSGRWPHIHFEVYPSLASATSAVNKIATSQMALPKAICDVVFATSGYGQSVTNLAQTSLATDNVFSDGATYETPTYSGDVTSGIALAMDVAVHAMAPAARQPLATPPSHRRRRRQRSAPRLPSFHSPRLGDCSTPGQRLKPATPAGSRRLERRLRCKFSGGRVSRHQMCRPSC